MGVGDCPLRGTPIDAECRGEPTGRGRAVIRQQSYQRGRRFFVDRLGTVFAAFDRQDSGCRSHGVEMDGRRLFLKASVELRPVPSVRRAVSLHGAVRHPTIIPLLASATTDQGLLLAYPWVEREVLYGAPTSGRANGVTQRVPTRGSGHCPCGRSSPP